MTLLKDTVAVINLDAMSVVGPTRDMVVIGLFFRSDHFSFAKYGVPALYAKGGIDHIEKGADFGRQVQANYTTALYHKPADEYDESWDLRGVVQDLYALYGVGYTLANNDAWPNYVEGNAFKAARDASRAGAVEPPKPAAR